MKSGYRPTIDARDYDLHKAAGVGAVPELPKTLGRTPPPVIPNQNADGLPFGCTDEVTELMVNFATGHAFNPQEIENITHANARGGADIRDALKAAIQLGLANSFYNVRAQGGLDAFDAARVALKLREGDKGTLSVGTPWFAEFESQISPDGMLPDFTVPSSLQGLLGAILAMLGSFFGRLFGSTSYSWHNWWVFDFDTINGTEVLCALSLQGTGYGHGGIHYIDRAKFNKLLAIPYSSAYSLFFNGDSSYLPQPVDLTWTEKVLSFKTLINNNYPLRTDTAPAPTPAPKPKTVWLADVCTEIRNFEGQPHNPATGQPDPNYRRNNPGNCRCSKVGYASIYGNVRCDNGFAFFPTYDLGWLYLNNLVRERIQKNPHWTFIDFFSNYSPAADGNQPTHYATVVATNLGLKPTDVLSQVISV